MSEQPPNPENNPNYLFELEKYVKIKQNEMLRTKHSQYLVLREITAKIRDGIGEDIVQKVRDEVIESLPQEVINKDLINTETEARLASILVPYAKEILNKGKIGFKQQNRAQEYSDQGMIRNLLKQELENLDELEGARNNARFRCGETNCHLNPESLIFFNSTIESFNSKIPQLAQMEVQLDFFPPLPQVRGLREKWIRELLEGVLFTDEQLQEQRNKINQAIYNVEHAVTLR